ncbi:hypothetical protein [Clostridium arbusti]|uniref:hypothetical protein n=1 Tax=Clostridium arbusti TaxID=1137848 RepID=UPI00028A006C|nr:hypothetical protein [Clostridium arbusti]
MIENIDDENQCKKYTNHTKSEIKEFIYRCFELIREGKKDYLSSNEKNFNFQAEYGIRDIWKVVLSISVEYFCYSADDYKKTKNGIKIERVYIFKVPYVLQDRRTDIYLKLKMRRKKSYEDVFVLSLHKPEKPLNVLWNDF